MSNALVRLRPQTDTAAPLRAEVARMHADVARMRAEVARLQAALAEVEVEKAGLEALAHQDPLTGLLNPRGFLRDLARAISYTGRYGTPAALLIVDLDRFKPINDRWGHPAGDRALRHVAELLAGHLRASDSLARLGGDEFAILIWQADAAVARLKGLALEMVLAETPMAIGPVAIEVSASIGSTPVAEGDDPGTALARADRAMYARKQGRRTAPFRR